MDPVANIEEANLNEWKRHFDVNFFSAIALVCTRYEINILDPLMYHRLKQRYHFLRNLRVVSY